MFSDSPGSAEQTAGADIGYLSTGIVEFGDESGETTAVMSKVPAALGDGR